MVSDHVRTSDDILRWLERRARELRPDEEIALQRVARLAYWLDAAFASPALAGGSASTACSA